jgi:hypothetical protein
MVEQQQFEVGNKAMRHLDAQQQIERVNLAFLAKNFCLESTRESWGPDLASTIDERTYELKGRSYPKYQANKNGYTLPKSSFAWWKLSSEQINLHATNDSEEYFIFILNYIKRRLSTYAQISERIISHRDMYVLPWNVHKLVSATPRTDLNVGLRRLEEEYHFEAKPMKRGVLHIAPEIYDTCKDDFKII